MGDRQKQAQIDLHRVLAKDYNRIRRELIGTRLVNEYWDEEIYKWMPNESNLRVLDNMCGTGVFLDSLALKYSYVVGADISFDMISHAEAETRKRLKGLVGCDTERLPFASASFDIVNIRGALHHINPVHGALREIHRVLRPGGTFILSEPCDDFFAVRKMREIMYRRLDYFDDDEKTFLSKDLLASLQSTGFSICETKRFGFVAYTLLGYPDVLPIFEPLNHVPFAKLMSKGLVFVDRLLAKVPVVKNWSLVVFIAARKPNSGQMQGE